MPGTSLTPRLASCATTRAEGSAESQIPMNRQEVT